MIRSLIAPPLDRQGSTFEWSIESIISSASSARSPIGDPETYAVMFRLMYCAHVCPSRLSARPMSR